MLEVKKASVEDEFCLRRFFNARKSGGSNELRLVREPNFFSALEVEGLRNDVIVAYDNENPIALVTRSEKNCFVNGKEVSLGYLSDARVESKYQKSPVLYRGFRLLKSLHNQGSSSIYLTTIMADNLVALDVFTSRRAGLPSYSYFGDYFTYVIQSGVPEKISSSQKIQAVETKQLGAVIEFLKKHGKSRQFFPAYTEKDLRNDHGLLKGLRPEDILIATCQDKIKGVLALWNQSAFRKWVGNVDLNYCFMALVCIENDDLETFKLMLDTAITLCQKNNYQLMPLIGFHERDPLRKIMDSIPHFALMSKLFVVHWEDGDQDFQELDNRVPYLELGSL